MSTEIEGRILVVDDFEVNRDLLKRRLEVQGYYVVLAVDGNAAIEALKKEPFDLILLDIMMPHVNGFDVLHFIKSDANFMRIPVIMISALDQVDNIVKAIEMGAEDYLTKPFNPVILRARIDACLDKKRMHDRELLYINALEQERIKSDQILRVILPDTVMRELKETQKVQPRLHRDVSIMFCDVVNFSLYCKEHSPEEVVGALQELVEKLEVIAISYNTLKLKTVGDAFMCASGLVEATKNSALDCVRCAEEMLQMARSLTSKWQLRIGIHLGPVIAGVVGHQKYLYDVWGEVVNIASRLVGVGPPQSIILTQEAKKRTEPYYHFSSLGEVSIKGKGLIEVFKVGAQKELSENQLAEEQMP